MAILGLESIVYGVEDMASGIRFWSDFGLKRLPDAGAIFETAEGATIVLRPADDPALPPAPVAGSTVREIVWGVSDEAALRRLGDGLAKAGAARGGGDGIIRGVDPTGYAFAVAISRRRNVSAAAPLFNAPGAAARIDRPAAHYRRAEPLHMAHCVVLCPAPERSRDFYRQVLGFRLTDSYPGNGYFLRCDGASDHHNLFLLKRGEALGFHHVAFDLRDIHELFGGGLYMQAQGWETHLGPGRHPISSAYFWYFRNPCGGAVEYDFDTDVITDAWQPRELTPTPESFAEWALETGIRRYGGVQTTSTAAGARSA